MSLIKGRMEGSWEFEMLAEGWYPFVVMEGIEITESEKEKDGKKEKKRSLKIPLALGTAPDKAVTTMFCGLDSGYGLKKILDVLVVSGLGKQMSKEKNLPNFEEGVEEEVVKSTKFLNYVITKLPGKSFKGEIKHNKYEKDGKEHTNANVVNFAPIGGDKAAVSAPEKGAASAKEEDWD